MGKEWVLKPQRVDNARQAGFRFWRFPGGSASDHYHWNGDYKKHPGKGEFMFEDYTLKSQDFIRFCKATDAEAIVTINFGLSRYGSLEEAKDLAARWVRYFNVENDFPVRYWEIGNEVFSEWETGYEVNGEVITGQLYAEYFREIADAMRVVDPNIFIGACAVSEDSKGTSKTGGFNFWMRNMLPGIIQQATFWLSTSIFTGPLTGARVLT